MPGVAKAFCLLELLALLVGGALGRQLRVKRHGDAAGEGALTWRQAGEGSGLLEYVSGPRSGYPSLLGFEPESGPIPLTAQSVLQELMSTFRPCGQCQREARIGGKFDGGYIMCEELLNKSEGILAAYSYGISGNDEWGAVVSDRLNIPVFQYDCFDDTRPTCEEGQNCQFVFHSECLHPGVPTRLKAGHSYRSLLEQMESNGHANQSSPHGHLLLKMDVDGDEWGILADPAVRRQLLKFSHLILEMHWVAGPFVADPAAQLGVMKGLLQDFVVVHTHGNNCCPLERIPGGYAVPSFLELTLVRRGLVPEGQCRTGAPGNLAHQRAAQEWVEDTPPGLDVDNVWDYAGLDYFELPGGAKEADTWAVPYAASGQP